MKLDPKIMTLGVDLLLPKTDNPRHRQILKNYRRHALLEVSGQYKRIFTPEHTVGNPIYNIFLRDAHVRLEGQDQVKAFYQSLIDSDSTVILLQHERIAVADWGFASEALYNTYLPGRTALAHGHDVDDLDATYIEQRWAAMTWPYDDRGRMIGENVYPSPTTSITKCRPEDVVSLEEAYSVLNPLVDDAVSTQA